MSHYNPLSEFPQSIPGKKKYYRVPVMKRQTGLRHWLTLLFGQQKTLRKATSEIQRYNEAVKKFNHLPAFKSYSIFMESYNAAVISLYRLEKDYETPKDKATSLDYNRQMAAYLSTYQISNSNIQLLPRHKTALKKQGLTNFAQLAEIGVYIPRLSVDACNALLKWRYAIEKKFTFVEDHQFIAKEIAKTTKKYPLHKKMLTKEIDQHLNNILTTQKTLRDASIAFEQEYTSFKLNYK